MDKVPTPSNFTWQVFEQATIFLRAMMVLFMAQQQAASDPSGARNILLALEAANPSRPEARTLLNNLFPPATQVEKLY